MRDLNGTKERILKSPHFKNGRFQNLEFTPLITNSADFESEYLASLGVNLADLNSSNLEQNSLNLQGENSPNLANKNSQNSRQNSLNLQDKNSQNSSSNFSNLTNENSLNLIDKNSLNLKQNSLNLQGDLQGENSPNSKQNSTPNSSQNSAILQNEISRFLQSKQNSHFRTILPLLKPSKIKIPSIKSDLDKMPENSFVWFGHSSYMLRLGTWRVLIDPVLGDNAAPLPFVIGAFDGADIYTPQELPNIDILIITHTHYDHLSKKTIEALAHKVKWAFVPLGVGKYLAAWGIDEDKITEMDWGEGFELGELKLHCLTARHYSNRALNDQNKTLWASFLLEFRGKKVFIGGDSGYGAHFKGFKERFGGVDVAFLENGQYNPKWAQIHAFPTQTLKIAAELNARRLVGVHNGKFKLAPHEWNVPLESLHSLYLRGFSQSDFNFSLLTPKIGQIVPLFEDFESEIWWRF